MLDNIRYNNINSVFDIERYINNHRAINHPLFKYLELNSQKGFTKEQYHLYRDNYFYRTSQTILSVAYLVIAAVKNSDIPTIATAGQNLYEESGSGSSSKVHLKLLDISHNTHGSRIFNLEPIEIFNIRNSDIILKEFKEFISIQEELYKSQNYYLILGAEYARETSATSMLNSFYKSFFLPYKNYYTDNDFCYISNYFSIHINGLEQEHADHSKEAAQRNGNSLEKAKQIFLGAFNFLESQSHLWDSLYKKLKNLENSGERIAPDSDMKPTIKKNCLKHKYSEY